MAKLLNTQQISDLYDVHIIKETIKQPLKMMLTLNPIISNVPLKIDERIFYNKQLELLDNIFSTLFQNKKNVPTIIFVSEWGKTKERLHWHILIDLKTERNKYTFWKSTMGRLKPHYYWKITNWHAYLSEYLEKDTSKPWLVLNPICGYATLPDALIDLASVT